MNWLQIVLGGIALAREIVKLLQDAADCKKDTNKKVHEMKNAVRRAREQGKTDDVEKMFRDLKFNGRPK